jgi:hypothetical protein
MLKGVIDCLTAGTMIVFRQKNRGFPIEKPRFSGFLSGAGFTQNLSDQGYGLGH